MKTWRGHISYRTSHLRTLVEENLEMYGRVSSFLGILESPGNNLDSLDKAMKRSSKENINAVIDNLRELSDKSATR